MPVWQAEAEAQSPGSRSRPEGGPGFAAQLLASDPTLPTQGCKAPLDLGLAPGSASPRPI